MSRIESVLFELKPGIVLVYGDVNSTVAAALVCSRLLIRSLTRSIEPCLRGQPDRNQPTWGSFVRPLSRSELPSRRRGVGKTHLVG